VPGTDGKTANPQIRLLVGRREPSTDRISWESSESSRRFIPADPHLASSAQCRRGDLVRQAWIGRRCVPARAADRTRDSSGPGGVFGEYPSQDETRQGPLIAAEAGIDRRLRHGRPTTVLARDTTNSSSSRTSDMVGARTFADDEIIARITFSGTLHGHRDELLNHWL
jgi:hypothetical protein